MNYVWMGRQKDRIFSLQFGNFRVKISDTKEIDKKCIEVCSTLFCLASEGRKEKIFIFINSFYSFCVIINL